jgi:protein TonB
VQSPTPDFSLAAIRDRPQFVYVDAQPILRAPLRSSYPRALAERKVGGVVTLWVLVSEAGRVEDVRVLRSSGHPELDRAAARALRVATYVPASRGGVAVPTWTRQQIAFRID